MMVQPGEDVLNEYSALYNTLLTYVRLCNDGAAKRKRPRLVFSFLQHSLNVCEAMW